MVDPLLSQVAVAFLLSLLGGLHCAGMCGGFIGALQINRPRSVSAARLALGYHAGRVTSYTIAGLLAGTLGGSLFAAEVLPLQVIMLVLGSVMLLAIGATLLGRSGWMKRIEPLGARVWQLIAPLARRVYPPRSARQALLAGLAWGWIPCGMVYAALPLALVAGGAWQGALVMFAFGLGTLPNLALLDAAAVKIGATGSITLSASRAWLRPLFGAVIVAFGVSGLAHAARVAGADHPAIAALASICHR
jgi:sulfite exporter TauE/SafE